MEDPDWLAEYTINQYGGFVDGFCVILQSTRAVFAGLQRKTQVKYISSHVEGKTCKFKGFALEFDHLVDETDHFIETLCQKR